MHRLDEIAERLRKDLETRTAARDRALAVARELTRVCSLAIRAAHRLPSDLSHLPASSSSQEEEMNQWLFKARALAETLRTELQPYPDLYYAGYTQDALKEFVEANITCALIQNHPLPTPEELYVVSATYLNGLAEAVGELRRRTLDILRHGYSEEAERLLNVMDEIYSILVTMDYPDAITNGLRRQTDLARSTIEKTRGDITFSLRGQHLEQAIASLIARLNQGEFPSSNPSESPSFFPPQET